MLKTKVVTLFLFVLLSAFQASSNNDEKIVFQELVRAYTAAISHYADTMIVPPDLKAVGYKQADPTVNLEYRLSPEGFRITGTKGTAQLTLNNEKQVFDSKMRNANPPDPKLLKEAPDVKVVSLNSAALAQTGKTQNQNTSGRHPDQALVKLGLELYASKACIGCHTIDGTRMAGPTLKSLYKQMRVVTDGKKVQATDEYLREAIRNPNRLVNEGYPAGMMPAYGVNAISEAELDALVAFIKSLK